jgi:hypothetical protein
MKVKMGESKFSVPEGWYDLTLTEIKSNQHEEYGAGIEWVFEVQGGEHNGKLTSRTTAPQPTPKNSCGKMIVAITGRSLNINEELDLDQFVGRCFRGLVEKNSTGTGTRVGQIMPLERPAVAQPKPALPAPPPPPTPAEEQFWADLGKGVVLVPRSEIQAHLGNAQKNPATFLVMTADQSSGWKPAKDFGFDTIPF